MSPLSICHLAFLSLIALYLCAYHPHGEAAVWAIFAAGVVAELVPWRIRRLFVGELLLIISAGASYLWLIPRADHDALHATAGMALSYWLLVPARLGMLRWVVSLAIVELLVQGGRAGTGLGALMCIPLGLAALAVDSWLMGVVPAKSGARLRQQAGTSLLRWALLPALLVVAVALSAGPFAMKGSSHLLLTESKKVRPGALRSTTVAGLDESLHIGNHSTVDRDPRIAARLSWDSGNDPVGTVYLRAMALSELKLDGATLAWLPARAAGLGTAPPPSHVPTRWARVLRMPSRTDVVLRCDGGDAVDLDGLLSDRDGNIYRPQLGEFLRSYRVDFDDGQLEADPADLARFRTFPSALAELPWKDIEDPHWREVNPERAAVLVRERLGERCHYDLEHLPVPAPGPGGVLRGFLFGRSEAERRGHCQYFATSAVLLLRRAGHTARCVAGFASNEFDDRGVVFRGLHAHAWIEVVNSKGSWQRFDPTPSIRNSMIAVGIDFSPDPNKKTEEANPQELPPIETDAPTTAFSQPRLWWATAAGLALVMALIWQLRKRPGEILDPRLAELQRRNDDLVRLALSLGVPVSPATALTDLAQALQTRTGVDLTRHLDAHLAARFGGGPLPEHWPVEELKAGARGRKTAPTAKA